MINVIYVIYTKYRYKISIFFIFKILVWFGTGLVWFGTGLVWFGLVWFGLVWFDLIKSYIFMG